MTVNIDELDMPESFTVSPNVPISSPNKKPGKPSGQLFQHDGYTFRAGQTYQLEDFPLIDKAEVFMFWSAGWVSVEGWPEAPEIDASRAVSLSVDNSSLGVAAQNVGG